MKKYKLINKKSCYKNGVLREGESCRFNNNCIYPNCCETICDKVTIDGFDYYVSDGLFKVGDINIPSDFSRVTDLSMTSSSDLPTVNEESNGYKKVIATNNPNIDIPKVVDEVWKIAKNYVKTLGVLGSNLDDITSENLVVWGYNKSQETHPFSEEDMIEFLNWIRDNTVFDSAPKPYHRKTQTRLSQEELLQLWKEQKPKIVYYE